MSRDVPTISWGFNASANVELEKALQAHRLTPDERGTADAAINRQIDQEQAEIEAFKDPEEFGRRLGDKVAELAQKPTPELHLRGGPTQTVPEYQLLQQADGLVRAESQAKREGFLRERDAVLSQILEQAREDGRGPEPHHQSPDYDHDQTRERE